LSSSHIAPDFGPAFLREAQAATKERDLTNSLRLRVSDNGLLRQSFVGQLPESVGSLQRDRLEVLRDDYFDIPIDCFDFVCHALGSSMVGLRDSRRKRRAQVVVMLDDNGFGPLKTKLFSPPLSMNPLE
jgi:hypothetical protein